MNYKNLVREAFSIWMFMFLTVAYSSGAEEDFFFSSMNHSPIEPELSDSTPWELDISLSPEPYSQTDDIAQLIWECFNEPEPTFLNFSGESFTEDKEAKLARLSDEKIFQEAIMDYFGQGRPEPDYPAARKGFTFVKQRGFLTFKNLSAATFYLASMDYSGYGGSVPDYFLARMGFCDVKNKRLLHPLRLSEATFYLAIMDFLATEDPAQTTCRPVEDLLL